MSSARRLSMVLVMANTLTTTGRIRPHPYVARPYRLVVLTTSRTVGRASVPRSFVELHGGAGARESIVAEYRVTGLSLDVIVELVAEVGPLWHERHQERHA
jgi:hypothetical protein